MITKKNIVFRVIDLAITQSDDKLNITLKIVIDNLSKEKQSKLYINATIVFFCYDNEQENVALVKFHDEVFTFLFELTINSLKNWQIEINNTNINFDCHFFEFIQLYTSKSNASIIAKYVTFFWTCNSRFLFLIVFLLFIVNLSRFNVIAIIDLDKHAYESWKKNENLERMWLHHFLFKNLSCCRTMIYDYNSKLSSHEINTIMNYNRKMIKKFKKNRNTKKINVIITCFCERKHEVDNCDALIETTIVFFYRSQFW